MANVSKSIYAAVQKAAATYKLDEKTKEAIEWFEGEVQRLTEPLPSQRAIIGDDKHTLRSTVWRGGMFMYLYNPVTKNELPYYDRFPLVIPVEVYRKPVPAFSGLNLHYLNYYDRARLLDMLQQLGSSDMPRLNRINYDILNTVRKYRSFRPCVHRYNLDRVISNMAMVPRSLWEIATFLPIEDFRKVTNKSEIWRESRNIYRKQ